MTAEEKIRELLQWRENVPEGRLVNRTSTFDLLEASEWSVITEGPGELELNCILPEVALNPAGQLFGGFTAAYVDVASLYAAQSDVEGQPVFSQRSTCDWTISKQLHRAHFELKQRFFTVEVRPVWSHAAFSKKRLWRYMPLRQ